MIKKNFFLLGLVGCIGFAACGSNSSETNSTESGNENRELSDSSNMPAQGMGDSTLYRDSNAAGTPSGDTGRGGGH